MSSKDTIVSPALGGSYLYMASTSAAFQGKKAYPYRRGARQNEVKFKKYTVEQAANLNLQDHCSNILRVYQPYIKNRKFNAVIFGAPNGAIVNLAIAMGVPYVCSQFRLPITMRGKLRAKSKDDLVVYARLVEHVEKHWRAECADGIVSCLVDPIHDRMDLNEYAHIREKFTDIPLPFRQFLKRHLNPAGTIIFVNMTYPWSSHRVGEYAYVQIGGLGDVPPEEYLQGSERIDRFLEAEKSKHRGGWALCDYPVVKRPESEWGTEADLQKAVDDFCSEEGYDVLHLLSGHPADFNLLATRVLYRKHTGDGGKCSGYSVNIFWGLCSTYMLRARLLGCWFTFTDRASLRVSESQLKALLSLFPDVPKRAVMGYYWSYPGAKLLDVVPPRGWLEMLSKYIPEGAVTAPGLTDLGSTEHDIFQYEDSLFEESERLKGNESQYQVSVEELRTILAAKHL